MEAKRPVMEQSVRSVRVLITNNTLGARAGSELYVRDVATALLARGHTPVAYSTSLGEVANEIRAATVPVISDLRSMAEPPDIIHGHHHLDVMTALLHFPGVPAICFCHGWLPWEEAAPQFPRILRYVAVSQTCRDRLVFEHGIPEDKITILSNFVDLDRFRARGPLPGRPGRALVFNNQATEENLIRAVRAACTSQNIALDIIGAASGSACAHPEARLGEYDLVFATGRSALEAMAVGAAVVLADAWGIGPMVTAADFDRLQSLNFGLRAIPERTCPEKLAQEIARYDAEDAAKVSGRVRSESGRGPIVDRLVTLYQDAIDEHIRSPQDASAESRAAGTYFRWLAPYLKERSQLAAERRYFQAELERVRTDLVHADKKQAQLLIDLRSRSDCFDTTMASRDEECERLRIERDRLQAELAAVFSSRTLRLRNRLQHTPVVGKLCRFAAKLARG
ncbi:MAG: glycosyltransferase [Gemmataceae bacterium]|nr:glycosyltransferase [Gemmataceae bacterium]